MRVLGIDHGSKRMGLALSDELGMIAQPLGFLPAEPFAEFLDQLRTILRDKQVEQVVVGLPRNMDGSFGPAALTVQSFVAALRDAITIPVRTWDERLSSAQANRALIHAGVRRQNRKGKVDQVAAAILLQSYLDARSGPA